MVKKADEEELRAICSECYADIAIPDTHCQPGWNDFLNMYVTTYRCETCRLPSLAQTRERIAASTSKDELATGVMFFYRYGITVPGVNTKSPVAAVRDALLGMIDRIRSGELRIPIDTKNVIPFDLPPDLGLPKR